MDKAEARLQQIQTEPDPVATLFGPYIDRLFSNKADWVVRRHETYCELEIREHNAGRWALMSIDLPKADKLRRWWCPWRPRSHMPAQRLKAWMHDVSRDLAYLAKEWGQA